MPLLVKVSDGHNGLIHEVRIANMGPAPGASDDDPGSERRYQVTDFTTEQVVFVTHARRDGAARLVALAMEALREA
jgi:hypothetical protein